MKARGGRNVAKNTYSCSVCLSLWWWNSPHFIGTMNPTRKPSNADLQLRQSFRWVLLSPSLEPVNGLLARHLRHGFTQLPREFGVEKTEALQRVLDWLPRVWEHVNRTTFQSACIGQLSFLYCVESALAFFIDPSAADLRRRRQPKNRRCAAEPAEIVGCCELCSSYTLCWNVFLLN